MVTPGVDEFLLLACDGVWEMMDTTQGDTWFRLCFMRAPHSIYRVVLCMYEISGRATAVP